VAVACWFPVLQYDDLAYHLGLPWQLYEEARYTPLPQYQVWSLAPWLSDVVQAMVMLMSGKESVGAVNAFWIVCLACGLWQISACMKAPPAARWLSTIAGVSIPATMVLAMGMQTELPTAAVLAWTFALLARPPEENMRFWLALIILIGGLVALKVSSAVLAVLPLVWAMFRHPWPSALKILIIVVLGFLVGCSSYVYSWILTGNPVLPLFNTWFQSPFYDVSENFIDARWNAGLNLWSMIFHTDRYMEASPGYLGFLLIALSGVCIWALIQRNTRTITVLAFIVFLLPLLPIQYARYAYPGLMVLSAVLVTAACKINKKYTVWIISGICILHLSFHRSGHWLLHSGGIRDVVVALGEENLLFEKHFPERLIASRIRQENERLGNIMTLSSPTAAEYGIRGRMTAWYSGALSKEANLADQDMTGKLWAAMFQREKIRDIVLHSDKLSHAQSSGLQMVGAQRQLKVGTVEWWKIAEKNKQ